MKLWFLPVHVLTSSGIKKIKEEELKRHRRLTKRQFAGLLKTNYRLEAMLRALAGGKRKKVRLATKDTKVMNVEHRTSNAEYGKKFWTTKDTNKVEARK